MSNGSDSDQAHIAYSDSNVKPNDAERVTEADSARIEAVETEKAQPKLVQAQKVQAEAVQAQTLQEGEPLTFKKEEPIAVDFLVDAVVVIFVFAFAAWLFLKKYQNTFLKKMKGNTAFVQHPAIEVLHRKRISGKTVLYVVSHNNESFLISESAVDIKIKPLSQQVSTQIDPTNTDSPNNMDNSNPIQPKVSDEIL